MEFAAALRFHPFFLPCGCAVCGFGTVLSRLFDLVIGTLSGVKKLYRNLGPEKVFQFLFLTKLIDQHFLV